MNASTVMGPSERIRSRSARSNGVMRRWRTPASALPGLGALSRSTSARSRQGSAEATATGPCEGRRAEDGRPSDDLGEADGPGHIGGGAPKLVVHEIGKAAEEKADGCDAGDVI